MMQFTIPHKRRKRIQAIAAALRAVDTEDELGLGKELQAFILNHMRAVELLRLAKKEIIEMSNAIWDEYEGVDEMERIDNELARELEAFLHELEGK